LVLRQFSRSNTSIDHQKPTSEIISIGLFRYSQNSVYVNMTLFVIGAAITVDSF